MFGIDAGERCWPALEVNKGMMLGPSTDYLDTMHRGSSLKIILKVVTHDTQHHGTGGIGKVKTITIGYLGNVYT